MTDRQLALLQESQVNLEAAFEEHRQHTQEAMDRLVAMSEENQRQLGQLISETRGLLQLYRDVQGVGRMGLRIQSFLAWVAKWPLIGGGVYLVLDTIIKAWKV